ncbi:hypothetical protein NQ314_014988 [Rhamnusium bicolor]|uniref:Uncharacterized protein n=1 Tax=Rhamnusium bicolor TaxID=1586634 RepID=A0AAV8X0J7_9CUCU|nr:hypothetical protein NQ314_014988 [Rhamnusium bicolor]
MQQTYLIVKSDHTVCNLEMANVLRSILSPQEDSIQVQALRRDVLRKFQEALDRAEEEDEKDNKRSLSSLAAWNNLPEHKRNLEALARAGYLKTLPDEEDGDSNYKRSLANLAKNGQLPMHSEGQKRGMILLY